MSDDKLKFERDGVVLLKEVVPNTKIESVRNRYDAIDPVLTNQQIPKDKPCIVFWRHVEGEKKRISNFYDFPELWNLIKEVIVPAIKERVLTVSNSRLQLLETIIFNKPPMVSNTLHWHQDVAYFPLKPNNQVAIWIPFEPVFRESGAMNYAIGSHKLGIRGSTSLHTREPFANEDRELIPIDPAAAGFRVVCMEMNPTDMLVHDGYIWHYSGPNKKVGLQRRGLSVRFIKDEAVFDPRPGQGAAFTQQIDVKPGEIVRGVPFPII